MTDIQAAIGIEQLKKLPAIVQKRRKLAAYYRKELSKMSWLKVPLEPVDCLTNWQSFPVWVLNHAPRNRNQLVQYLLDYGVSARFGVMNAHEERPYFRKNFALENSKVARESVLLLPLFHSMKDGEIRKVVRLIQNA
jgi:dTDP-4-amino-4,6-dideoxygalactose transaminase